MTFPCNFPDEHLTFVVGAIGSFSKECVDPIQSELEQHLLSCYSTSGMQGPIALQLVKFAHNILKNMDVSHTRAEISCSSPVTQESAVESIESETVAVTTGYINESTCSTSDASSISDNCAALSDALQSSQFVCRSCRTSLFDGGAVTLHHSTNIPMRFEDLSREYAGSCSSWFLAEPPSWLGCADADSDSAAVSGKIYCPCCQSRLGSWNWAGARCSCE